MGEACGTWGAEIEIEFNKFSPKEKDHLEELGTDGSIRVYWYLNKLDESLWSGLIWHSIQKRQVS
jgi:hypothetical protein